MPGVSLQRTERFSVENAPPGRNTGIAEQAEGNRHGSMAY